jgi:hypothetical protein
MKKVLFTFFALAIGYYSLARNRKLEIVCYVYNKQANYADMPKVLPDSLKSIFVKVDKKWHLDDLTIVNMLTLHGWTLSNYSASNNGDVFILKREIILSNEAYKTVLENFKKPEK